jgi:hypothetical protein
VTVPETIEGLVYLRPEFTPRVRLTVQPEIVVQGGSLGLRPGWWIRPRKTRD